MKINWFERLYVGDRARQKRYRIIQSIRKLRPMAGIYVITPSLSGNNILDIYRATELCAPWYEKEAFFILGIAADYEEALTVAGRIVAQMYAQTKGFDLTEYLKHIYR